MSVNTEQKKNSATLSSRLRELRGHRSQADFAEVVGLKQQSIQRYETDQTEPKSDVLCQIAERCEVSVDWLLCLTDDRWRGLHGSDRQIGSVRGRELLAYRRMPIEWLEKEVKRMAVDELTPAPKGRGRLHVVGALIEMLLELQERHIDELTGKGRDREGKRE